MGRERQMSDEEFREYRRQIARKSQRKRRDFAKLHNLCRQCCKKKAVPLRTLCPACLLKQREVQKRYTDRIKPKKLDE